MRFEKPEDRKNPLSKKGADRYKSAHWGSTHRRTYKVDYIPGTLVEMGDLLELHVEDQGKKVELEMPEGSKLVFGITLDERLYPVVLKRNLAWMRGHFIAPDSPWYSINEVATEIGGRQAEHRQLSRQVQALGRVKAVVYRTTKRGDGSSEYIHEMGEDGGISPMLVIDREGRLWFAGGTYFVADEGITY